MSSSTCSMPPLETSFERNGVTDVNSHDLASKFLSLLREESTLAISLETGLFPRF